MRSTPRTGRTTRLLTSVLWLLLAGLAGPVAADDSNKVNEDELRSGCDFDKVSWEQGLAEPIGACASECFKALRIVGEKAQDYQHAYRVSLWVGAGVTVSVGAALLLFLSHFGGHRGFKGWQMLAGQFVILVIAFGAGLGAHVAVASSQANPQAESMFWDLWHLKRAGKTGQSFSGDNFMTCSDRLITARLEAEGADNQVLLAPFAAYAGVFEHFDPLPTDRAPQAPDIQKRFGDMGKVVTAADEIDSSITETSPVPFDNGPVRVVREATAFPKNFWTAGSIAVVLAFLVGLALRALFSR